MIYFCTIAYKEKYIKQSFNMIKSIEKYCPKSIISIVSDHPEKYLRVNCITREGPYCEFNPWFRANYKSYAFDPVLSLVKENDIVIFLDCDCYLTKPIYEHYFDDWNYGLYVDLGKNESNKITANEIVNMAIRNKILTINSNEQQLYQPFREAFLGFKVDKSFFNFVKEWQKIYVEIDDKNLNHANVTFDIQNACFRSNMNIYNANICNDLFGSVKTDTVDGGTLWMV